MPGDDHLCQPILHSLDIVKLDAVLSLDSLFLSLRSLLFDLRFSVYFILSSFFLHQSFLLVYLSQAVYGFLLLHVCLLFIANSCLNSVRASPLGYG